jgi:cation transporter-like permease
MSRMLLDVPLLLNMIPASLRCVAEGMSSHGIVLSSPVLNFLSKMLLDVPLFLNLIPACVAEGMCFWVDVLSF